MYKFQNRYFLQERAQKRELAGQGRESLHYTVDFKKITGLLNYVLL